MSGNEQLRYVATLDTTQLKAGTQQAGQAFDQVGNKATTAGNKIEGMSKRNIAQASLAFTGMATSIWMVYQAYDALEDVQLAMNRAQVALTRATDMHNMKLISLQQAELKLAKLQEAGKKGTTEYTIAIDKLAQKKKELQTATDDLAVKQQDLAIKTDNVKESQVQFGLTMSIMATSTIPMSIKAILDLTKSAGGLKAMFLTMNLTMGKWILIATAVVLAFEGIAHAIKYFTGGDIDITIEKLGSDLMGAMSGSTQEADKLATTLPKVGTAYGEVGDSVGFTTDIILENTDAVGKSVSALQGLDLQFTSTAEAILQFNQELQGVGTKDLNNRIEALVLSLSNLDPAIDRTTDEWKRASNIMKDAIKDIAMEMDGVSETRALAWVESIRKMGKFTVEEFNDIRESIIDVKKEMSSLDQKKTKILEGVDEHLNNSSNLALIREILDQALFEYDNGNIAGALFLERRAQEIGRGTSSLSGSLRSISTQLREHKARTVSRFIPRLNGIAQSSITGTIGSISHILSRVQIAGQSRRQAGLGGSSVAHGGNRSKGRSSKHGGANRNFHKFDQSVISGMLSGGMSISEMEALTGLTLDPISFQRSIPIHMLQRGGSASQFTEIRHNSLQSAISNAREANLRINLMSELSSLGVFDSDIMNIINSNNGYKTASSILQGIINTERLQISSNAEFLGMSQADIIASRSSILTQNDISNMIAFKQKESLAMITV